MSNLMPLATLQALSVHPFADEFPYISDEETLELAQDIEANGLHHPVVLYQNEILDGRNRLRALAKTNLTVVPVEEYTGDDPIGYIVSLNLARRHLTTGQRAALAVAALPYYEELAEARRLANLRQNQSAQSDSVNSHGRSDELVAEKFGVGQQAVARAKSISLNAEDLYEQIKQGTRSINDAYNELKRRQDNAPGSHAGDKPINDEDQYERFEKRLDRAVSNISDAIADLGSKGRPDDLRYVRQALENLIRQAERTFA